MAKTKYANVYRDPKGKYFYNIFLGRNSEGKQVFKKGRSVWEKTNFQAMKKAMNFIRSHRFFCIL